MPSLIQSLFRHSNFCNLGKFFNKSIKILWETETLLNRKLRKLMHINNALANFESKVKSCSPKFETWLCKINLKFPCCSTFWSLASKSARLMIISFKWFGKYCNWSIWLSISFKIVLRHLKLIPTRIKKFPKARELCCMPWFKKSCRIVWLIWLQYFHNN